jgi:general secretion pathway protein B
MSILMAALKQQQQTTTHSSDSGHFYRKLALVLALLLALLTGAVAAYLLMPLLHKAPVAQADTASPAQPDAILAALKTLETQQAADAAQAKLAAGLTDVIAPAAQPEQEEFSTLPAVKTLTAGTAEAEPRPVDAKTIAAKPVETTPVEAKPAEVSAELRDKFASALKATEQVTSPATGSRQQAAPATDIKSLPPQIQRQIPPLRFEAHVYATTASQRWVKVNGKTLQEGQWVTADIRIREITAQYVLLEMGSELFSVPALSSWPD